MNLKPEEISSVIKEQIKNYHNKYEILDYGTVLQVGDGIARVYGLSRCMEGELLEFESGVYGMALNLEEDNVGVVILGSDRDIKEGDIVKPTGKIVEVPVGEALIGRVVDALGNPIDGKGEIVAKDNRPIEYPAPGVLKRKKVNRPLQTGIKAIDAMMPIGKGQRELIIGDRQTGKTGIAIDTILNQKGKNVVCIYVAIGQKASSVAQLTEMLRAAGALEYTTVVCASASDFASMQYIAPYAGCALGEYFMEKGRDVLIVYDDLSKHAIAYRALSLLLERSPGREAYPGDVFYLHSRLLERSAHLSDERGGGSMTALPIVETLDGDVSAYIPTNIISITDGQIYLESNLFFAGQRPAVNVGLSVSRVGGAAQTKAMKKAVGTLRLDLAQYREMEVFTQFSSDLDDDTKQQLVYGQSLMRILRQGRGYPYSEAEQVVLLVTALGHIQQQLPVDRIGAFNAKLLSDFAASRAALMQDIGSTGVLTDENRKAILEQAKRSLADFLSAEAGSGR